jgi:hypothetical protein
MDDDGLCRLLDKPTGRADIFLDNLESGDRRFIDRMGQFVDEIARTPERIAQRVETLLANAPRLTFVRVALENWGQVRDAIRQCGRFPEESLRKNAAEFEGLLVDAVRAVADALSTDEQPVIPMEVEFKTFEGLFNAWVVPQRRDLIAESRRLYPLVQLKATDDTNLCQFLNSPSFPEWRRGYPPDDPALRERFSRILHELPNAVSLPRDESLPEGNSHFRIRLSGLKAGASLLKESDDQKLLGYWQKLDKELSGIKDPEEELKKFPATERLGPLLFATMRRSLTYNASGKDGKKLSGTGVLDDLCEAIIGKRLLSRSVFTLLAIEQSFERSSSEGGGLFGWGKK